MQGRGFQPTPVHGAHWPACLLTGADTPTSRPWPLLFCLLGHCFSILAGPAAALPPPGSLQNLPGQGCSVLRQDSPSDDQVALTKPDHIAVLLGDENEGSELSQKASGLQESGSCPGTPALPPLPHLQWGLAQMPTDTFPHLALTSAFFSARGFGHLVWLPPLPSSACCSVGKPGCGESVRSPPEGPASVMVFTSEASELVRCSGIRATRNL